MKASAEIAPVTIARIAGLFYLLVIVTSPLAMFIRGRVIVGTDPAASMANLVAHEGLYRLGLASDIVSSASYIVVTGLFYVLFKPVDRSVALVAALFSTVAIAVGTIGGLFNLAPLTILRSAANLGAFSEAQLGQIALLSVKLGTQAVNIGIILFGCYCLSIGWLILRSKFLPSLLGAGMILAGLGWLSFLYQPLASAIVPFNMLSGAIGEGALTLWLLAVGVNGARWREQAGLAAP